MKVLVSIPAHEQPDVITNQMENLNRYMDDPIVILHLCEGFHYESMHENVFINPHSFKTVWRNAMLMVHKSNIKYMIEHEWDYLLLAATNEMMIRSGIEKYMKQYDVGIQQKHGDFYKVSYSEPRHSQIEGVFIKREIATTILSDYNDTPPYPDEEYILPSMIREIHLKNDELRIGSPITFFTGIAIDIPVIESFRNETLEFPKERRYFPEGIFSVKRIERNMADPIRQYLS